MRKALFSISVIFLILQAGPVGAQTLFSFVGEVDFVKNQFDLVLHLNDESSVAARALRTSDKQYQVSFDIDHLQTPFFDLLSKIESSVELAHSDGTSTGISAKPTLKGHVWSQYSLVDYKPINELSGSFEIKGDKFYLNSLAVGNMKCQGSIEIVAPYKSDLSFLLGDMPMEDFLKIWGVGEEYDSSGFVSGEIHVSGVPGRMSMKGNLEGHNGHVQKLDYDTISLNIEGIYPNMTIVRSMVSKSDGVSFTLEGPLDLSDKDNFKKQLKGLTYSPLVSDSGREREWTIKRINPDSEETTELKYRFRKGDALSTGTTVGDEIDMLGIERTRKF